MKDLTLLKISLICSVLGIIILYAYTQSIETPEIEIGKLNQENIGNTVTINGRVSKIIIKDNFKIIDVVEDDPISIFLFGDEDININKGEYVRITGEVEEYNGKMEIIAEKIEKQ